MSLERDPRYVGEVPVIQPGVATHCWGWELVLQGGWMGCFSSPDCMTEYRNPYSVMIDNYPSCGDFHENFVFVGHRKRLSPEEAAEVNAMLGGLLGPIPEEEEGKTRSGCFSLHEWAFGAAVQ